MKYDRAGLIERKNGGEALRFVLFWLAEEQPGCVTQACLSQWYPASFEIEGVLYLCAEQYMMAQKAALFGDWASFEQIMNTGDPARIKKLGRGVRRFDAEIWDGQKRRFVLQGNFGKLSQNGRLRDYLLSTGDAVLAEASPYDRIWGISLTADDPHAQNPMRWRGENLLGFVLMQVRDMLRGHGW